MQFYDGAVLESFVFKIKEDIGLYKLGNPICQTCLLVYFLVDLSLQLGSLRMADENILKRMIWLRIVHRIKSILEYSEPLKKKSLMNPVPSYFFYLERLMYESYLVGDEFPACTAALNGTLLATFGSDFTTLKKICHLFRLLVWKRFPELLLFPPLVSLKQNL